MNDRSEHSSTFLSPNNHPSSPFKVGLAGVFPIHLLLFIGFLYLGFQIGIISFVKSVWPWSRQKVNLKYKCHDRDKGIRTEGGRLSTVDLLIKVACFVKT
jgi:hypothetical protein